nr:AAA family ATPase [Mycobacterium sp. 1245805.9]
MRVRVALHTGEAELRDGDYFGRAVNRAARLRSLAAGGQILCSGATAELVIDSLPDDVVLADLGTRQLRNLARPEHVFELRLETAEDRREEASGEVPLERPGLPAVLAGPGPFVGRGQELERLFSAWQTALAGGTNAVLIAGEPGVGKTRLAGEWSRQAYDQGALVIYGRCDEDLGAPYQPFAEALRSLVPCLGSGRLRELRGVEALLPLVPALTDVLPDLAAPTRADPDTERYALFDAVVALLGVASASAPVVLILDDLHWAAKPTLLLLRHLLRFGERARVQIIGTYRSTDLDRSHPLSAMLADLHRDGTANRLQLGGLDEEDVSAYVAEAGYNDEELARALASVTGGNPFFLIEALRHVEESGGRWDQSTLPQGVREAVSRRLSRLTPETNKALAAAAVVGSRFALELVERVVGDDLVDPFDEACKAGIVIEEPGGHYRFNHALVRQSLLAELPSVRRMRLHQRIATTLENEPGADDELLAELAHHYFECAWAGNAVKAVEYCRRAADQAMARLAYEGAADLYDRALHALEEIDDELPDRDDQTAELLIARCEALLAAGDVASAAVAVSQLQSATVDSARLSAWATCFDGQLSMLTDPERLDEIETAVGTAAATLAELGDAAGEATAHTVRAGCLARLGRIGDCEVALDDALTAARRAREHRRVNAVLANAPLAALWGPNPVPRAGGRCLDVVRLLRITTDSPAVEATSTRCQAVLEAFRGRAAAARRMIDSARRTVTELGLRHARLEVEQFAGIVELVVDDPGAAEPHLRKAYNGFRRMGLDADTAETAALLGRVCLTLGQDAEADELCTESERLAGHALKPSIAWRTLRAQLLSRGGDHEEARRVAGEAVSVAERTDALVDHGDACLALATVLAAAGDVAGARAAAERAVGLWERKGAAALAEKARQVLGAEPPPAPALPEAPPVELDNACVRVVDRLLAAIHSGARDVAQELYAREGVIESRRKIIGFTPIPSADWAHRIRRVAEVDTLRFSQIYIAVRGERLALARTAVGTADDVSPGAPRDEFLSVMGIDATGRIALQVWFDVDDLDDAIAELDAAHARFEEEQPTARRLENAATRIYGRILPVTEAPPEPPSVEPDNAAVRVGERVMAAVHRGAWEEFEQLFAPGILIENRRKVVGLTLPSEVWRRGIRRELEMGARTSHVMVAARGERLALARMVIRTEDVYPGAPYDELLHLYAIDDDGRVALQMFFDVEDMDAALAELDATHARFEAKANRAARRLENTAARVFERVWSHFADRDWDAVAETVADDYSGIDRRRVVNAGTQHGRDSVINDLQAAAGVGFSISMVSAIAIRGERLVLARVRAAGRDPEAISNDALNVVEIDAAQRIATTVTFDVEDLDAAIAELDARYLAGEAAAHAHTWSVVAGTYASISRHEFPAMTPDCVTIDHRPAPAFAPGALPAYIRAGWDLDQSIRTYVEVVHRLTDLGAVCSYAAHGVSHEGFDAEWREIAVTTVEGEMISRCELFDEADLDAAFARFEQLGRPAPHLENAASRAVDRYVTLFAARDWDALAEVLTDDMLTDDRRRVANAGTRHGREDEIANLRAVADVVTTDLNSVVVAVRGERLVLTRMWGCDRRSGEFLIELLAVAEINSHDQIAAIVLFDLGDFAGAIAELDARYLVGEAAAHRNVLQPITDAIEELNRHEPGPMLGRLAIADYRRVPFGSGEPYGRAIEELWTLVPDARYWTKAVHALDAHGLVSTLVIEGTDAHENELQWDRTFLFLSDALRVEVYEEDDVDAALTRFEELRPRERRLENAASQAFERYLVCFAARDWEALAKVLANDIVTDDRRRVVNAGVRRGLDAEIANLRAAAGAGFTNMTSVVIAARGERLILARGSGRDRGSAEFLNDVLGVVEINSDDQIAAIVVFDVDDFDSAIAELDARYLAGEAAPHAHTWSVIAEGYAAFNRRELAPTTPDWVCVDHRRGAAFAAGDFIAYIQAAWDDSPDTKIHIAAVHRLSNIGAVVTHVAHGISQGGFDAEWRDVFLLTVEGDLINREELFSEADVDDALTRFDQLNRSAPRLENAASQAVDRYWTHFAARAWDALAEVLADNIFVDDRRGVVNAGVRHGRDAEIANLRAVADAGFAHMTSVMMAARGERLILVRTSGHEGGSEEFLSEGLGVVEINSHNQIAAIVVFDLDDTDAAFAELDARYLTGEAAAHARSWSVIAGVFVAHNRRELPTTTPDAVSIDHRRGAAFAPGEGFEYIRAGWDLDQNLNIYIETAHRLNDLGAVFTWTRHGTSREGFDAEWRGVTLMTVDGEMVSRMEVFDETDLDSALARFDQLGRPAPQLENAASQAYERFRTYFAARDWAAMAELLTADTSVEDHRRVVNAEVRRGRDVEIANMRAFADIGVKTSTATIIATRGERLVLSRTCISSEAHQSGGFRIEMLIIVETSTDNRILARVAYDPEDIEAAFAELDARYLAGEAAAHARTWSVLMEAYAALNRHEMPSTTPDWVNVDHRRGASFASGDMPALLDAAWNVATDLSNSVEAVHRLNDLGAVVTNASRETSHEGFDAEWRVITVVTVEDDMLNRCEVFDETDLEAAIARFDELTRPTPRLENTATRVWERLYSYIAACDWDAVAQISAENVFVDDRRRVVNAGILRGRDANIKDAQATVDVGFTMTMLDVLAIRGGRLALTRVRVSGREPEAIQNDALSIVEIDADERIMGVVVFDLDDFDDAIADLDARYVAGEAAAHARTWSVITRAYSGSNRNEFVGMTTDSVFVDRRPVVTAGAEGLAKYLRAAWDLIPGLRIHIEAVQRLSESGGVITHAARGTSQEGFDAEWRTINVFTVEGDLLHRVEAFDEADLEAALARFEQLSRPAPRLENVATQVYERVNAYLAARDWPAMAATMAQDVIDDDRRRMANSGVRSGRDAVIAGAQTAAALGAYHTALTTLATRGDRLALCRLHYSGRDQSPEAFYSEALGVIEIDAGARVVAHVMFDFEDLDAAFEELEARYLAGEGAAHAHTWSVIAEVYAALNRNEMPAVAPDLVDIDHRPLATIGPGDFMAYLRASLEDTEDTPRNHIYIEAVHRLTDLGAVTTHVAKSTSREGFAAEWRITSFFIVDGGMINRYEIYDEADIDAAIASFEQLSRQARRLENAATRVNERIWACFDARDWDTMSALFADDMSHDDRRRMVGAGVLHGRDAQMEDMRSVADIGVSPTVDVIATRGKHLALTRARFSGLDQEPHAFLVEALIIVEIDGDGRMAGVVAFDPDDIDSAITELDARYIAGEAAAHAHTWSVITEACAALNQRQLLPTTPDWVNIDHRQGIAFAPGDLTPYIRSAWNMLSDGGVYIETAHRLDDLGAVVTWTGHAISHEGSPVEFRGINVLTVSDNLISRCEIFDETDLDTALARFEELSRPAPRLDNAASKLSARLGISFASRDWVAITTLLADDICTDDRRPVVGVGIRRGRDAEIASLKATAEVGTKNVAWTPLATRGENLVLGRVCFSGRDQASATFIVEVLGIIEANDNTIAAVVIFDLDDVDAAFAELDARYLAGEAADHAQTWSPITGACAAFNRHELPATTPDSIYIDHRPVVTVAAVDLDEFTRATWDLAPSVRIYIEAVHSLSDLGAVVTLTARGSSENGFDAEWRMVDIFTVDGDLISRNELFDEADLEAALATFDQLEGPVSRLENDATRARMRTADAINLRDVEAVLARNAADARYDDRRKGLRDERAVGPEVVRAIFEAPEAWRLEVAPIAIRGSRLALTHDKYRDTDDVNRPITAEHLMLTEVNAGGLLLNSVLFDPDDIEAAFQELDARYLAGEAAAHARTWSVIAGGHAGFNRQEPAATTPNVVYIDHRPVVSLEGVELRAAQRAVWDLTPDATGYVEAVHRLSELGTVITQAVTGTSQEGFAAEWRMIAVCMVEGDLLCRYEVFDEADLDAALARFEELHPPTRRPENAASRVSERFWTHFAARDWDAMAELTADDICSDDRRRVVNGGVRNGREAHIADMRVIAEIVDPKNLTPTVVATRGARLALSHIRSSNRAASPDEISAEVLSVVEIDADGRIVANIGFDIEDIDAALAELDARYLAGEAAAHAHTWSVIVSGYAAFNRHDLPPTTSDLASIDHRRTIAFPPGGIIPYIQATWDVAQDVKSFTDAIHRLNDRGAVFAHAVHGTSQEGFGAEWREIVLVIIERDQISRIEVFDEEDLDAALARFDELHPTTWRLENAASRMAEQFLLHFADRDWDAMTQLLDEDMSSDDRRRVVNAGIRRGRDAEIANWQAVADIWMTNARSTLVAIRGERLALFRITFASQDQPLEAFQAGALALVEINDDNRGAANVVFDLEDIDAALEELDARYLAGEAATHAEVWSVIAGSYSASNRHELPGMKPDSVYVDNRAVLTTESEDLAGYLRSVRDLTPDISVYIETVHRLSDQGAVITQVAHGTSHEGFDAEWRAIVIGIVDGDLYSRVEVFDEADVDAALARFEELQPQAQRLANAASRVHRRLKTCVAAHDWNAVGEILAEDIAIDDRRRVVNSGIQHGRDAAITDMRSAVDLGLTDISLTVIATRGARLELCRTCIRYQDQPEAFRMEFLSVVEINAEERIVARVAFDLDEIDAAFEELDARYLAGEAAAHSHVWSVVARECATFNRHELPAADWVTVDHRRLAVIDATQGQAAMRAIWEVTPDLRMRIEAVHRLSSFGVVALYAASGTSPDGVHAEWPMILVLTVEGDRICRCEVFDEADLDAALTRFEELQPQPQQLKNAAGRVVERFQACFSTRDWAAMAQLLADNIVADDRRRVVNAGVRCGRDVYVADVRAAVDVGAETISSRIIATRSERLALAHVRAFNRGFPEDEVGAEWLVVVEIDAGQLIVAMVIFDMDDIDAAFEELDARYRAGEAAAHAHTWSLVTRAYAALNRRQLPEAAADWVNIDHRRLAPIPAGGLSAYLLATWDLSPRSGIRIEAVHRLSKVGAVVTQVVKGTSHQGFEAEWRTIDLSTYDGDKIKRTELFDEDDLDAALARFDELNRPG